MSAIQTIETELGTFFKQREQAIANIHAVDGAIQAAQHLLAKLRAEESKVVAEVTKVVDEVKAAVEGAPAEVAAPVVSNVVAIDAATKSV